MKTESVIPVIIAFLTCRNLSAQSFYSVIPQPQTVKSGSGKCIYSGKINVVYDKQFDREAQMLVSYLSDDFGMPAITSNNKSGNYISLSNSKILMPDEAYQIDIKLEGITITASTGSGIFYGLQSLRQIMKRESGKLTAQCGSIDDKPEFGWRSFLLDEGRYFKGKVAVKQLLDEMALLKLNKFHWHLTDDQGWRIEIKKYPLLTEIGSYRDSSEITHFHSEKYDGKPHFGFYTQDDIREIVEYAALRHIEVVPEIEMPGHASAAIAAYPWLGVSKKQIKVPCNFGVKYDVFDVSSPETMKFFEDVFDEVIGLFPSKYLHIGGDEIRYNHWNESESIKKYMAENGVKTPAELQVFFTSKIARILESKGRQMIGWNEITGEKLHEYQSDTDTETNSKFALPKDVIVYFWKGEQDIIKRTAEKGNRIINVHHAETYLDYSYKSISLKKAYGFYPIPEGMPSNLKNMVMGSGCQMWGEFIPKVTDMNKKVYPRIAAFAECGWSKKESKDYDRFLNSLKYFFDRWDKQGIGYSTEY